MSLAHGYRIVERSDAEGQKRIDEDFKLLEERLTDYELAILLETIGSLKAPPMDSNFLCEILNDKFEMHLIPFSCRRRSRYFGYAFAMQDKTVILLGVFWQEGHFSACEWLYEQTCKALFLVDPVRERVVK